MSHVKVSFDIPEYVGQVDALGTLRILEAVRILGLENKTKIPLDFDFNKIKGLSNEIRPSLIILSVGIILFLSLNSLKISNAFLLTYFILSGLITSILIPHLINKYLQGHSGDS